MSDELEAALAGTTFASRAGDHTLESALAELTEAREKLEAVRVTLAQVLDVSHGDQAVVEKAKARLERIDAEVASVERVITEAARQLVKFS